MLLHTSRNNLYGWSLCSQLPYGGFRDMTPDECERLTVGHTSYPVDGDRAIWLEVDLAYDRDLHDAHNDFPLAPETRQVSDL